VWYGRWAHASAHLPYHTLNDNTFLFVTSHILFFLDLCATDVATRFSLGGGNKKENEGGGVQQYETQLQLLPI
jgi:hypothetical protein